MASQSAAAYMAAQAPECASVMIVVAPATSCNAKPSSANLPKKSKRQTVSKSKSSSAHPPYLQMIVEAISALKDRTGSSHYAIAKWLEDSYPGSLPGNFKKKLFLQLKRQTENGKLIQVKNSYKLSDELKKSSKKTQKSNNVNIQKKPTSVHIKKAVKLAIKSTACKNKSTDSKPAAKKPAQKSIKPVNKLSKCANGTSDVSKAKQTKSANGNKKSTNSVKTKSMKTVIKKTVKLANKPAAKKKVASTQKKKAADKKKKAVSKASKTPCKANA